jgi:hypothetical protein
MIINETYVNENVIVEMNFIQSTSSMENSRANIRTTSGSQIQAKCTKEQYMSALSFLSNKSSPILDLNLHERLVSILEDINEGLGEWQGVESVHCPEELQSLKKAQEEIELIIHDLEVSE